MKVSVATEKINIKSGDVLFWGEYFLVSDAESESGEVDTLKLIKFESPCIYSDFGKLFLKSELEEAVKDGFAIHYPQSEYCCKLHKRMED